MMSRCKRIFVEDRDAERRVRAIEREVLRAMRALADFDVLCKLSEKLCTADREYRKMHRRKVASFKGKKP